MGATEVQSPPLRGPTGVDMSTKNSHTESDSGSGKTDRQQRFDSHSIPTYLKKKPPKKGYGLPAEKEREYYCENCGRRVTMSIDDIEKQYGHRKHCDHSMVPEGGW
jgi:hypothetical protein